MPGSKLGPRLVKGALVVVESGGPPRSIVFQYNPHTLTRKLQARRPEKSESGGGGPRLSGPPKESISLEVEIDATDQLDAGSEQAERVGIHPELALLEGLLYPSSGAIKKLTSLLGSGEMEIVPPAAPLVLFVWGSKRVVPVRIDEFSVTEEAYDPDLNPLRAKVSLGLGVLSYEDLSRSHPGYHVYLSHHIVKETMEQLGGANQAGQQQIEGLL